MENSIDYFKIDSINKFKQIDDNYKEIIQTNIKILTQESIECTAGNIFNDFFATFVPFKPNSDFHQKTITLIEKAKEMSINDFDDIENNMNYILNKDFNSNFIFDEENIVNLGKIILHSFDKINNNKDIYNIASYADFRNSLNEVNYFDNNLLTAYKNRHLIMDYEYKNKFSGAVINNYYDLITPEDNTVLDYDRLKLVKYMYNRNLDDFYKIPNEIVLILCKFHSIKKVDISLDNFNLDNNKNNDKNEREVEGKILETKTNMSPIKTKEREICVDVESDNPNNNINSKNKNNNINDDTNDDQITDNMIYYIAVLLNVKWLFPSVLEVTFDIEHNEISNKLNEIALRKVYSELSKNNIDFKITFYDHNQESYGDKYNFDMNTFNKKVNEVNIQNDENVISNQILKLRKINTTSSVKNVSFTSPDKIKKIQFEQLSDGAKTIRKNKLYFYEMYGIENKKLKEKENKLLNSLERIESKKEDLASDSSHSDKNFKKENIINNDFINNENNVDSNDSANNDEKDNSSSDEEFVLEKNNFFRKLSTPNIINLNKCNEAKEEQIKQENLTKLYNECVDKYQNQLSMILIISSFLMNLDGISLLYLKFPETFSMEIAHLFHKKNITCVGVINFLNLLCGIENLNHLNLEFNTLNHKNFYKVLGMVNSNSKLNSLRMICFPTDKFFSPSALYKLCLTLGQHPYNLLKEKNINETDVEYGKDILEKAVLSNFLENFQRNLEMLFWIVLTKSSLSELVLVLNLPEIIRTDECYQMVLIKFIINILLFLGFETRNFGIAKIIAPNVNFDARRYTLINPILEQISCENKGCALSKMQTMVFQLRMDKILKISNLVSTNLISLTLGDFDIESFKEFTKFYISSEFISKTKLAILKISLQRHIWDYKCLKEWVEKIVQPKPKHLNDFELFSGLLLDYDNLLSILQKVKNDHIHKYKFVFNTKELIKYKDLLEEKLLDFYWMNYTNVNKLKLLIKIFGLKKIKQKKLIFKIIRNYLVEKKIINIINYQERVEYNEKEIENIEVSSI